MLSAAEASPSFSPTGLSADLIRRLTAFVASCEGAGLHSLTLALPGAPVPGVPDLPGLWSWWRPSQDFMMLAHGIARRRILADETMLAGAVQDLAWTHADPCGVGAEPAAFLGHAFSPAAAGEQGLPAAILFVPAIVLRREKGRTSLVVTVDGDGEARPSGETLVQAALDLLAGALASGRAALPEQALRRVEERPDRETFLGRVASARAFVAAGRVEKVVLSREVTVEGERPFAVAGLLPALARRYPGCAVLCADFDGRQLVAASPERLVERQGVSIASLALAGTAARQGQTPFPDRRLLASDKDRVEHRPVVRHIAQVLGRLCEGAVEMAEAPVLMELGDLQHLATPISGRLASGFGLLDAALALHPTPAISGWPGRAALDLMAELGETRRGWYAGAMGWIDRKGDGEMVVILRAALVEGARAVLAAGGGIVAASDPNAELAETELKLGAMLGALGVA